MSKRPSGCCILISRDRCSSKACFGAWHACRCLKPTSRHSMTLLFIARAQHLTGSIIHVLKNTRHINLRMARLVLCLLISCSLRVCFAQSIAEAIRGKLRGSLLDFHVFICDLQIGKDSFVQQSRMQLMHQDPGHLMSIKEKRNRQYSGSFLRFET